MGGDYAAFTSDSMEIGCLNLANKAVSSHETWHCFVLFLNLKGALTSKA